MLILNVTIFHVQLTRYLTASNGIQKSHSSVSNLCKYKNI